MSAQGDFFVDLSSRSEIDLTPYAKDVLDAYCTINDKLIALPMGTNGFGAMINKNFFEKYNIPLDTVWTWESMIEEGKKVHEQDPNAYLFAIESGTSTGGIGPFVLGSYIYSQTGKYWADDASYSIQVGKEDLQKAFTVIKELFDSGAAQPLGEASLFTGQMEQNPKWLNAEMGFTIDWSATIGKYKSAVGEENFTVAQPPFAADGDNQRIAYKPSMVLGISSRSANVDAAANFTNWLLNDKEAVEILGTQRSVPNNQNAFDILNDAGVIDKDVAAMCAFSSSNPAPAVPALQGNTEVADVVKDICEQVIYGKLSPDAAADKFMTDIQEKLDALKASK